MKIKIGYYFVTLYFIIFIISNSLFVTINDNIELDSTSLVYWLRHLVVIIAVLFSFFFSRKNGIHFYYSLFTFSIIYFIGNQFISGLMTIALFLSTIIFGTGYEYILKNKKVLFIFLLIALLPFFINFQDVFVNGLLSSKYGRDRMLLGYFHPKEAAQPFAIIFILLYISFEKIRIKIFLIGVILLYLIGSKNSLLYFLIFVYLTYNNNLKTIILLIIFCFIMYFIIINLQNITNLIDELSSDRISAWADVLKYKQNDESKFRADSFYIETFVKSGFFGISLFIIWLLYFMIYNNIQKGLYSKLSIGISLVCAQLVFSMLDSGIASTGSLIQIFSWSMYFQFSNKYI
jgi:hypothetical protein